MSCFPQLMPISGYSVQLPTVWKSAFSKISPKSAESYLCNKNSDSRNKLRNTIPLPIFFLIFYFLDLNQNFGAKLWCKCCVQVPNVWKTFLFIFATKCSTKEIKQVLETPFLCNHILLLFKYKLRFQGKIVVWRLHPQHSFQKAGERGGRTSDEMSKD